MALGFMRAAGATIESLQNLIVTSKYRHFSADQQPGGVTSMLRHVSLFKCAASDKMQLQRTHCLTLTPYLKGLACYNLGLIFVALTI